MDNALSSIIRKYGESGAPEPKPGDLKALTARITPVLITKAKRLPRSRTMELEDLVNIGLIAAFEGAPRWKPDGGASLSTFAITAGYRAMLAAADESRGVIRIPYETNRARVQRGEARHHIPEVSGQSQVSVYVDSTQTVQDLLRSNDNPERAALVMELERKLDPKVFDTAVRISNGESGHEAGQAHGVSRQAIFLRLEAVKAAIESGGDLRKGNYKATKKYEYDKTRYTGNAEYRAAKREKTRLRHEAKRAKRQAVADHAP